VLTIYLVVNYNNDIKCEKLKAKYEHLYSSFQVSVNVDPLDMKDMLAVLMAPESSPTELFHLVEVVRVEKYVQKTININKFNNELSLNDLHMQDVEVSNLNKILRCN